MLDLLDEDPATGEIVELWNNKKMLCSFKQYDKSKRIWFCTIKSNEFSMNE